MKKLLSVISMILCGITCTLTSCSSNDNAVSNPIADNTGLRGTWACTYDISGTAVDEISPVLADLNASDEETEQEAQAPKEPRQIDYIRVTEVYQFYGVAGEWHCFFYTSESPDVPVMEWGEWGMGSFDYTLGADGMLAFTLNFDYGQQYPKTWTAQIVDDTIVASGLDGRSITLTQADEDQEEEFYSWTEMLYSDVATPMGGKTSFEEAIVKEMNLVRSNPANYANTKLQKHLKRFTSYNMYTINGMNMMTNGGTQRVQEAINKLKGMKKVAPLTHDPKLTKAAKEHTADMCRMGFLTHTGSDGSNSQMRIVRYAGNRTWTGENCAQGVSSSAEEFIIQFVVDDGYLSGSFPHLDGIMNPNFQKAGAAVGEMQSNGYGWGYGYGYGYGNTNKQYMCTVDFSSAK